MQMNSYQKKLSKNEIGDLTQKYINNKNTLSDVALLVQRNEDLHNKCKSENERLRLKVNRLLKKINVLNKKIDAKNKKCQTTVS